MYSAGSPTTVWSPPTICSCWNPSAPGPIPRCPGRGLFHHRDDGTFTLDGPIVDLRDRMTKWQYLL